MTLQIVGVNLCQIDRQVLYCSQELFAVALLGERNFQEKLLKSLLRLVVTLYCSVVSEIKVYCGLDFMLFLACVFCHQKVTKASLFSFFATVLCFQRLKLNQERNLVPSAEQENRLLTVEADASFQQLKVMFHHNALCLENEKKKSKKLATSKGQAPNGHENINEHIANSHAQGYQKKTDWNVQ